MSVGGEPGPGVSRVPAPDGAARNWTGGLGRRAAAEGLGTGLLLAAVVGSGIMAQRLSPGSPALALLANGLATGAALVALILTFAEISGAQFNPVVTLAEAALGHRPWREVPFTVGAQVAGAFCGVGVANAMFGESLFSASHRARPGWPLVLAEAVATLGLLAVVFLPRRRDTLRIAVAVGCYITAAYWFTSSTSFANPAVTLARAMTDTFTGIRPADVPGFLVGQFVACGGFLLLHRWLLSARTGPTGEEG